MQLEQLILSRSATIVDVRSRDEFSGGHVPGSLNIPLHEIPEHVEDLRTKQPLVLCCASGNRSGQAQQFLSGHNIECYNGGSWLNVNHLQNKTF